MAALGNHGFAGPVMIGLFRQANGNYSAAMAALAVGPAATAIIVLALGSRMPARRLVAAKVAPVALAQSNVI